ncbi:rsbT co-antagonist protein RsbR [Fictibacillus solisalsi]|uniref:RsbT co-antagonist protein RsbR n=1 Tax=Fictibacillus solisalsi TaxID=459525 RepID=A0A1G9V3X0_9BACL|nr:STAS domain-containing protein [Fictibacillus solisalsi]SDM66746.1 rsbT co-antagonist protein RsbR [Fictibacillus solisalsi]
MNRDIQLLGEELIKRKQEIAEKVHLNRMAGVSMTPKEMNDFKKVEPTIMELRTQFINLFGESLIHNDEQAEYIERVREWGKETGDYSFKLGAPLDEALKDTNYYRRYIWEVLKNESTRLYLSAGVIFEVIDIIDPLLDEAVYYFSLTYIQSYKKVLDQAKSAFLELSVPIVPLVRGTGVLPLVGNIDTERAQHIMEETLTQALNLKLENLIIDLSGVMIVDTMVADQLYKVIDALSLLGVSTILTGIRPEVAQIMVSLGLDIDKFVVRGNLHQAFLEVRK